MRRKKDDITYTSYRTATLQRRLMHLLRQKRLVDAYLAQFIKAEAQDAQALGFNLMYDQARRYPAIERWCKENRVRVIHLIRRNALKIVVSREVAKKRRGRDKTGWGRDKKYRVYVSTKPLERTVVNLNLATLQFDLHRLTSMVDHNRALFGGGAYIEVEYESFVAQREFETTRILDFLGVDVAPLSSDLVKTSPDSLSDVIANFHEVCQELKGTRYEHYLN